MDAGIHAFGERLDGGGLVAVGFVVGNKFEGFVQGRDLVSERNLRNHAARKLTSERVSGQKPLAGVGQRFPRPIDSTTIRGDESVALGQIGGDGQSRNACGCGKAGGHKLAT